VRIPSLETVLHSNGDFAVLTTSYFLKLAGVNRVGFFRCGWVLQILGVREHVSLLKQFEVEDFLVRLPEAAKLSVPK
jgi:hypothetical protein